MPAPLTQTTGRRKQAVARVRFRPGAGAITINKRPFEAFFTSATHRMAATEPLRITNTTDNYDIEATIDGGGPRARLGRSASASPARSSNSTPRAVAR